MIAGSVPSCSEKTLADKFLRVQCHESTWIVISINILQTIVNEISRNTTLTPSSLINIQSRTKR